MYDSRLGRFFARDPLSYQYPHNSPYAFSENVVTHMVELDGLESTLSKVQIQSKLVKIQRNGGITKRDQAQVKEHVRTQRYVLLGDLGLFTNQSIQPSWSLGYRRSSGDVGLNVRQDRHENAQTRDGYYGVGSDAPSYQFMVIPESALLPVIDMYDPIDELPYLPLRPLGQGIEREIVKVHIPDPDKNKAKDLTENDLIEMNKSFGGASIFGSKGGPTSRDWKINNDQKQYGSARNIMKEYRGKDLSGIKVNVHIVIGKADRNELHYDKGPRLAKELRGELVKAGFNSTNITITTSDNKTQYGPDINFSLSKK